MAQLVQEPVQLLGLNRQSARRGGTQTGAAGVGHLERVAGRPPHQQGHGLAVAFDDLSEVITHRTPGPQMVMSGQQTIEPLHLVG